MVAVWSDSSAPALAVKVAEVALAATLTEEGTVNAVGALLESATTVLLVVDFDRVTVQVVLALEARLAAAHCSEDMVVERRQRERGWLGRAVQRRSDGGGLICAEGFCRGEKCSAARAGRNCE